MININRTEERPNSLNSQEIKEYLDKLAIYATNGQNMPFPEKPPPYRYEDVLDEFNNCFYAKCYLTEMGFINSHAMDIDHFIPKSEEDSLTYEWTNLFPIEHYTNMIRPRVTPNGGYMNPCEIVDDVEKEIIYTLDSYGISPHFTPRNNTNVKAINTCKLLERVHLGHDSKTIKGTAQLRHVISKKYIDILLAIIDWKGQVHGTQKEVQARMNLKDLLSRKNSFTMLCRSIPAVLELPNVNEDWFD
jgi:hypothetical protein